MKQKLTYLCTLAALLTATACTHDEAPAPGGTTEGTASAAFHIQTRADGTGIGQNQHAWLYLAERPSHLESEEGPHCLGRYNVSNGSYLIENLRAQWYKMAFICLPECVKAPEADEDYNSLVIDYSNALLPISQGTDKAIYRKIIDRWLMPGEVLKEEVKLTRITGQLILNMGILKDQFPKKVVSIKVDLGQLYQKVYLRDNGNGEILFPDNAAAVNTISYLHQNLNWESNDPFETTYDLLPKSLDDAKVTVTLEGDESYTFKLVSGHHNGTGEQPTISIKPNTRTTVYFRGMEDEEFEVRYDGFDGQEIDVDEDWNGWN